MRMLAGGCKTIVSETSGMETWFLMLYLVNQFPSAAFRLKDIWHYLISGVFELFIRVRVVIRLVSPIIAGRTLGSAAKRCQVVLGRYLNENVPEFLDLSFGVSLVGVQCRRKIVQFACEFKAVVQVFEFEQSFLPIYLRRSGMGF